MYGNVIQIHIDKGYIRDKQIIAKKGLSNFSLTQRHFLDFECGWGSAKRHLALLKELVRRVNDKPKARKRHETEKRGKASGSHENGAYQCREKTISPGRLIYLHG